MLLWEMCDLLKVEVIVQVLVYRFQFFQDIALSVVTKVLNCHPTTCNIVSVRNIGEQLY